MLKKIYTMMFLLFTLTVNAASLDDLMSGGGYTNQPLPAEDAFPIEIEQTENGFLFLFDIVNGHYLYKEKIKLFVNDKEFEIKLPNGEWTNDEYFGDVEVFYYGFDSRLDYNNNNEKDFNILLESQGCSSALNLCYPIMKTEKTFKNPSYVESSEPIIQKESNDVAVDIQEIKENETVNVLDLAETNNVQDVVNYITENKDSPILYLSFVLIGVLVAFTPCIYPMMPIIIASTSNSESQIKASAYYVLGVALSYGSIGLVSGLFKINPQILLQGEWTQYLIPAVLIFASLYLFDVVNKSMPSSLSNYLNNKISSINTKKAHNQVVVGYLSSLLLSPCSIAPLLGVLVFVNQIGSPIYGAILLSLMGLGIGIPLFILSTSFKKFMPKNGVWMVNIKNIMGYAFLILAIYLIDAVGVYNMLLNILTSIIFISYGLSLFDFDFKKKAGFIIIFLGILFSFYNLNAFQKTPLNNSSIETTSLDVVYIGSIEEYNLAIKQTNKPIFIDFYADWCITCVRLENNVLNKEKIKNYLNNNFLVLKIDLTDISSKEQELMDQQNIIAIPYYVFMDKDRKASIYTGGLSYDRFFDILKMNNEAGNDR